MFIVWMRNIRSRKNTNIITSFRENKMSPPLLRLVFTNSPLNFRPMCSASVPPQCSSDLLFWRLYLASRVDTRLKPTICESQQHRQAAEHKRLLFKSLFHSDSLCPINVKAPVFIQWWDRCITSTSLFKCLTPHCSVGIERTWNVPVVTVKRSGKSRRSKRGSLCVWAFAAGKHYRLP